MEIVLSKEDVETLIKQSYSGVENIKFNTKNLRVNLTIDINKFNPKPKTIINTTTAKPPEPLTQEQKNAKEVKQGAMASGGVHRAVRHMG